MPKHFSSQGTFGKGRGRGWEIYYYRISQQIPLNKKNGSEEKFPRREKKSIINCQPPPGGGWSGDVGLNSITEPVRIGQEDVASFTVSIRGVTGSDGLCAASDP